MLLLAVTVVGRLSWLWQEFAYLQFRPSATVTFWIFGEPVLDIAWVAVDGRGVIPTYNGRALKQKLNDADLGRLRMATRLFPEAGIGITAIEPLADGTVHA
jgi:hypothetical protein